MKETQRYARVTVPMIEQASGLLSYQELCALIYMLTFCGTTDGQRNPYKRGQPGIMEVFKISASRAKRILTSLHEKGFLRPIYRIMAPDETIVETRSLKQARHLRYQHGGRHMKTYYDVRRFPDKKPLKKHAV